MTQQNLADFIWNVADALRGPFKPSLYGRIILPFTVLRRLECVLEPTRDAVLAQHRALAGSGVDLDLVLPNVAGASFYNTSRFTLVTLGSTGTRANLEEYVSKFSANARQIFDHFGFDNWLVKLEQANLLYLITQKFAGIDLHPARLSNHEMGLVFEHLIRKFAEADDLRYVLTGQSEDEWEKLGTQERLSVWQASRQRPGNASYFAFTATPKHSTLSLFGRPRDASKPTSLDNPPVPFHTYTMQQAIEEDFILDVLRNYTSYKTALRLGAAFERGDDRRVDKKSAGRALARWLSLHPTNIAQKVELIVEHFRTQVAHLLDGQAKAMIVTPSRAAAVKYHLGLERYCQGRGYADVHAMVAFSGDVPNKDVQDDAFDPGHAFNEANLNPGLKGREMRRAFDTREYRVMIVANKFQTGFDQPKLVAMYIDKKVSGVEAVQTLSRLNRKHPGKDKTFVIDFANEAEEIERAFRTFYRDAQVSDVQDPNIVYDIKQKLDATLLYEKAEVQAFAAAVVDRNVTHQKLYSLTQAPTDRFNSKLKALNDAVEHWEQAWRAAKGAGDETAAARADVQRAEYAKERDALLVFSEGLSKFVRTYEYVAQLVDFGDPDLEGFASFARLLRKRLKGVAAEQVDLSDLVLTHFKVYPKGALAGVLKTGEAPALDPITDNGLREARDREKAYLSELVKRLNDALGKEISDTDQVALAVHVSETLRGDTLVMAQVQNNDKAQAMKANLPAAAVRALVTAMTTHEAMAKALRSDETKRGIFIDVVYELLKKDAAAGLFAEARGGAGSSPRA